MAEVIDIKNGELLEIYTRLPLTDHPKESRVFSMLGNEWSFSISLDNNYYEAYLLLKTNKSEFNKFEIDYEVGFRHNEASLEWNTTTITNQSAYEPFWVIEADELEVPFDYDRGNILLIKLRFHFQIVPVLNRMSKPENKTVQTSPYMDSSYLLERKSNDFLKLFQDGSYHDVQLICGDKTIKAHKAVLCCCSAFFASKFENEYVNDVKIENMDSIIFEQFFRYFYTGVLPELSSENAIRLYEAAVDYSVDALGKVCASFLVENLSHDNAVEVLKIADRHKDLEFKNFVMEYMTEENTSLMGEKWAEFCKENSTLANEVLNLYIQQPRPKKPRLH